MASPWSHLAQWAKVQVTWAADQGDPGQSGSGQGGWKPVLGPLSDLSPLLDLVAPCV